MHPLIYFHMKYLQAVHFTINIFKMQWANMCVSQFDAIDFIHKKKLLLHSLLQVEFCMHLHALSFQSNVYLNIKEKCVSKREIKCKWTKIHSQQQFDICVSCLVRFKYSILFNLLCRFAFIAMTISIHFTCVS